MRDETENRFRHRNRTRGTHRERSLVSEESVTAPPPGPSPTGELGLSRLGELERRLTELYEKGMPVAVDKYGRTTPVDVPEKPERSGVDRLRRVGAANPWLALSGKYDPESADRPHGSES